MRACYSFRQLHPLRFAQSQVKSNQEFVGSQAGRHTHTRPTQNRTGAVARYTDRLNLHARRKDIDCGAEIRERGFGVS